MKFPNYIVFFHPNQKIIHKKGIWSCFEGGDRGQKLYFLREMKEKYNLAGLRNGAGKSQERQEKPRGIRRCQEMPGNENLAV